MHPAPRFDVRRSDERFVTRTDWLVSRHSFSFGQHYDPDNTGHGLLVVNNEDVVAPGAGFDQHPHRDMEILTWVLAGSLVHQDSTGHRAETRPGLVQRMSAGRGVLHSERNDAARTQDAVDDGGEPVHYVQMWLTPDEFGLDPGYDLREMDTELRSGEVVPVASGRDEHVDAGALRLRNRSAALHAARPRSGSSVVLPDAASLHLFVTRGAVEVEAAGPLATGDALRVTGGGGQRVRALEPAEILIWEMHVPTR